MRRAQPAWVPPMRDGVSASRVTMTPGPWRSVAEFLAMRLPAGQDWLPRLARGEVLNAGGHAVAAHELCVPGQVLWYWRCPPPETPVPFDLVVLHHDEHCVVVDKPHFLATIPRGRHLHETVLVRLKKQLGISTLVPMHRLDRETAGVMVLLVQPHTRSLYQGLLRAGRVHKVYEAVAPWRPDLSWPLVYQSRLEAQAGADFMQMRTVPGPPNAQTQIELVQRLGGPASGYAHYRLTPLTGRKHQLRAQLCALGMPIVGDRIYPVLWPQPTPGVPEDFSQPLQLLARSISWLDPLTGRPQCFTSRQSLAWVAQVANGLA